MIIRHGLADLDELVLCCREEKARSYVAEAVACYHAGAFRQCIVATWIAVVYDFIHKLQELDLTGDKNARTKIEDFEKICAESDVKASLVFERAMLDVARDQFELITSLEYADLVRLQDDRNRCAHPSMNTPQQVYQPTAELARSHLRNAVEYLLSRPPVQGKAALERLQTEVTSEYFPEELDLAIRYFENGPLKRPRESLVRNFLVSLLKRFLLEDVDESTQRRHAAAVGAVRYMHHDISQRVLTQELSKIMRSVEDEEVWKMADLLRLVPDVWEFLEDDVSIKMLAYFRDMPDERLVPDLLAALDVPAFKKEALARLDSVGRRDLYDLIRADQEEAREEFVERAVELYEASGSFEGANFIGLRLIAPFSQHLQPDHVTRIIVAASTNDQISGSFNLRSVFEKIRKAEVIPTGEFDERVRMHNLSDALASSTKEDEGQF